MIDPHVHLRDWNQAEKETVAHGLAVAKRCGFTHVFDMPNTDPPLTCRENIVKRFALAKPIGGIEYHLWAGLTANPEQIAQMVEVYRELHPKVVGLKLFLGSSTGNMGVVSIEQQRLVFSTLAKLGYGATVAVHAEKESLFRPELYRAGQFQTHSDARPPEAEIESVRDVLQLAKEVGFGGTIHVAHVSTAKAIELVKQAKKAQSVTMGATPHHALFTKEDAKQHDRYLKMNPPLREESDRKAVFEALLDGTIDWIESDHAPHTKEQKEAGASGIPGFENMLLLIDALKKAGISETRLMDLTFRNAAKLLK